MHAITAAYGTAGLRERLTIEIEPLPEADQNRIATALNLATRLHVTVTDPDVICAALLHDLVEDHPATLHLVAARPKRSPRIADQFAKRGGTLEANLWARVIKVSDFTDNAVGLVHTTGPRWRGLPPSTRPSAPSCET